VLDRTRLGEVLGRQFASKLLGEVIADRVGMAGSLPLDEFDSR